MQQSNKEFDSVDPNISKDIIVFKIQLLAYILTFLLYKHLVQSPLTNRASLLH